MTNFFYLFMIFNNILFKKIIIYLYIVHYTLYSKMFRPLCKNYEFDCNLISYFYYYRVVIIK